MSRQDIINACTILRALPTGATVVVSADVPAGRIYLEKQDRNFNRIDYDKNFGGWFGGAINSAMAARIVVKNSVVEILESRPAL